MWSQLWFVFDVPEVERWAELNTHPRFLSELLDLNTKFKKIFKWRIFNTEIIDFGSLKLGVKWGKTLNQGTLNGGSISLSLDFCVYVLQHVYMTYAKSQPFDSYAMDIPG
jgi:hypothetical protein